MEEIKIIGIYSVKKDGVMRSTLFTETEFSDYQQNNDSAIIKGNRVETIYVGNVDVSNLEVGDFVEVIYGRAVNTKNGIYQPVKAVRLVTPK